MTLTGASCVMRMILFKLRPPPWSSGSQTNEQLKLNDMIKCDLKDTSLSEM